MSAEAATATARVFFALWPSSVNAEALGEIARREAASAGGKPTRPETIHLTLAFIGDVAEARLPALINAAAGVSCSAFSFVIDQLAYWPHNRIRWAGCSQPPPELPALAEALRSRLLAADFAVDRGKSGFLPHLTLLRKCREGVADLGLSPPLAWQADEFVLVRSQLAAGGSQYRVLQRFPLLRDEGGKS